MMTEEHPRRDWLLHQGFEAGILLKGLFAAFELISGVLLWLFGPRVLSFVQKVALEQLLDYPDNRFIAHLQKATEALSLSNEHFYALYLAAHGLVKLVLVAGLWVEADWAFPTSIAAMLGFVAYQLHLYSHSHAIGLLVLSALDLLIVALIWREYRARRAGRARVRTGSNH